eukprot:7180194-Pyramimonas_sp.AAC.1
MALPILLGLSLLRYNRAGAWLRLRRSCWLGSHLVAELAYGGQLLLYPSPSTALSGGQHTWWNIRVQWVCAEECK